MLALLCLSDTVEKTWEKQYGDKLVGVTTTSLYGKSIQYDRLPNLKFVGYTKGNSVYSIPSEVTKLCSQYLKSTIGYTSSRKFIILQKAFDILNIPKEDILTSTNLIRKGLVLDKVLESIIVEPGVKIDDLFIGDKNAILIASRVLAYGADYQVTVTDPTELEPVDVNVDMTKLGIKEVDDSIFNRINEYDFILPKNGNKIKFKLLS